MSIETVTLNNGVEVPLVGLGTRDLRGVDRNDTIFPWTKEF